MYSQKSFGFFLTPFKWIFFKQGFEFGQSLISFSTPPTAARYFFEVKIFTEITFRPVVYPFCHRLPAFILRIFIIKAAVQTAMEITATMRTDFLAPGFTLDSDLSSTGVTYSHISLYT